MAEREFATALKAGRSAKFDLDNFDKLLQYCLVLYPLNRYDTVFYSHRQIPRTFILNIKSTAYKNLFSDIKNGRLRKRFYLECK
jgi:hypothetical protein